MQFSKFPLVRIAFIFALGILAEYYVAMDLALPIWVLVTICVLLLLLNKYLSRQLNLLFAILAVTLVFELGYYHSKVYQGDYSTKSLSSLSVKEAKSFKAQVVQTPVEKENSYQVLLLVYELDIGQAQKAVSEKVLVYADKDKAQMLKAGDLLYVNAILKPTQKPVNPHAFNYKQYLSFQNIHYQGFIGKYFLVIGHKTPAWLVRISNGLRAWASGIFKDEITDERAKQVAMALILGQRNELDQEVSKAYASAGAMHVLAVSGLHVGLIYLILSSLFQRLPIDQKYRRWVVACLCIVLLFFYALITGLSPSVLRAFVMFSFIALAKATNRPTNIFNTLAASALVILLYDPFMIMSVGFQLSYIAVIGIVILYPKFYGLFTTPHWLLDKVWSITCVSIAAQLATAPLSMLYFHQFPSYFLISNLFVIPAAFLILILGLLTLFTSFFPYLSSLIAQFLSWTIELTNLLVFEVGEWPGGTIVAIQLSVFETWLVYGVIISLSIVFLMKRFNAIYAALAFSAIFAFSQIHQRASVKKSKELLVYQIPNHWAIELRDGFYSTALMDSVLRQDIESQQFHLQPYHRWNHIKGELPVPKVELPQGRLMVFDGKSIAFLDKIIDETSPLNELEWNLVITNFPQSLKYIQANEFVLNSRYSLVQDTAQLVYQNYDRGFYSKKWR